MNSEHHQLREFRAKLKSKTGRAAVGGWFQSGSSEVLDLMIQSGFDWIGLDLEHGSFDLGDLPKLLARFQGTSCVPYVRLADRSRHSIRRSLDLGAMALILPAVETAQDVKLALREIHYPPQGSRGIGYCRANDYGEKFSDYFGSFNDSVSVIIQIEGIEAVSEIETLFAEARSAIDGYFVGPYDLSGSMGIVGQFEHPEFQAALSKMSVAAKQHDIAQGIHVVDPLAEKVKEYSNRGYRIIALGTDALFLKTALRSKLQELRNLGCM